MQRIAQLTDLHLLEPSHTTRRGMLRRRLSYLSFGRPLDAGLRYGRAKRALAAAVAADVDHVFLTGDLTEDGSVAQFEVVAELLSECGLPPERVTLLAGNHDLYTHAGAFSEALRGPLAPWAETSAVGAALDLGGLSVVSVNTAHAQHYFWSNGSLAPDHWRSVLQTTAGRVSRGQTVLLAQHHPATPHALSVMQWIDGLHDHAFVRSLLEASDRTYVMHGHVHEARSLAIAHGQAPRIFSAGAVVDGEDSLRVYAHDRGEVVQAPRAARAAQPAA